MCIQPSTKYKRKRHCIKLTIKDRKGGKESRAEGKDQNPKGAVHPTKQPAALKEHLHVII